MHMECIWLHISYDFCMLQSEPIQLGRFQAVLNSNQDTYSEMFKYFIACPTSWMPGSQGNPALSVARACWQAVASREMDPLPYCIPWHPRATPPPQGLGAIRCPYAILQKILVLLPCFSKIPWKIPCSVEISHIFRYDLHIYADHLLKNLVSYYSIFGICMYCIFAWLSIFRSYLWFWERQKLGPGFWSHGTW